ncbi:uncharacterized protein LOC110988104 [Acanthaster planci]|uniref:Uncharacterized protein LOC110988104 n=1 Tax=Acanthaster planci TaxID=133434 RepID=A0A8B7ZPS3_ACAPL|nr:uncharacterized protein LOC110988104 [Acanthaster planci]
MSNTVGQISRLFLRHRNRSANRDAKAAPGEIKAVSAGEGGKAVLAPTNCSGSEQQADPLEEASSNEDTAPPTAQQLQEEIESQRKMLHREFDMERMHKELLHIEVEKLHMARENQLMNRQFMAVLKERRALDRERKEMIAAAVEVWRELSGDENFKGKKVHNLNEAISKALHQPASASKIKEEEPRLLRRLRACKTESEVRKFQADLKKKQEALFQLLLKSETMIATGSFHQPKTKDRGGKDAADTPRTGPPVPPKPAVKRSRLGEIRLASSRPVGDPPPRPPDDQEAAASNLQPIIEEGLNAQLANERQEDDLPTNDEPEHVPTRNVLTWNLDVMGIQETSI